MSFMSLVDRTKESAPCCSENDFLTLAGILLVTIHASSPSRIITFIIPWLFERKTKARVFLSSSWNSSEMTLERPLRPFLMSVVLEKRYTSSIPTILTTVLSFP